MKIPIAIVPLAMLASYATAADAEIRPGETAIAFVSESGDTVDAFEGHLFVPENRNDTDSREITLKYVRFPATGDTPGAPIIYLSGGPGGSGIQAAKYQRFPLFMAMREFGDVIAFDQRGTGASNDTEYCRSSQFDPEDTFLSDEDLLDRQILALNECMDFWKNAGVDPTGYNTLENVADLDALREHLGADRISLWVISYGSHLAFAALKEIDDRIDRVVIASAEGLDKPSNCQHERMHISSG